MKINKTDDKNIFFIGDTHFYHKNVILYDDRPFKDDNGLPDIQLMNEELIKNWNRVVKKTDVVFHLGDVVFGGVEKTKEIVDQLNGEIHLIMGNHDSFKIMNKIGRFSSISDRLNLYIKTDSSKKGLLFILDHFAILSWDKQHKGSIHLHAHSHGSLMKSEIDWVREDYYKRKVIDVGCMNLNYTPISYDEVIEIMDKREIINVDHHNNK